MLLIEELLICTVLLVNDDDLLSIQKVLISLTTVRVIWIWKISLDILGIYHLDILGLTKLNVMLLLLYRSLLILLQLTRGVLHFLCHLLLLLIRVLYQISCLCFNGLRICFGHVPRIRSDKGAGLCKPSIVAISELIEGTL